jgi:subtilisin
MKKLALATGLLALAACQQQGGLAPQSLQGVSTYIAVLEPGLPDKARMAEKLSALEREHGLEIPAEDRLEALGAVILRNLSPAKAERLAKDPRVYALSPDQEVRAYGDTIPWGVARIGAPTTTFLDQHLGPPPSRALPERPADIPHPSPHALGFWDGNPTQPTGLRPGPPGPGG